MLYQHEKRKLYSHFSMRISQKTGGGGDTDVHLALYRPKVPDFGTIERQERKDLDPSKAIDLLSGGSRIKFGTTNDDGPWKWKDTGKSFGFDLEYANPNLRLWASVTGYTDNTSYDKTQKMVGGKRIDTLSIQALWKVDETQIQIQDRVWKLVSFVWIGIDGVGKFWMQWIQKGWHAHWPKSMTGGYNFNNTYEKDRNGKDVSGLTPTILWRVEWSLPLIWNENKWINLIGSLDGKVALNKKYGETALSWTIGIEWNYERLHGYIGVTTSLIRILSSTSQVINKAINNPKNYITVWWSIDAYKWRESTTTIYAWVNTTGQKEQTQGTIWIKLSF